MRTILATALAGIIAAGLSGLAAAQPGGESAEAVDPMVFLFGPADPEYPTSFVTAEADLNDDGANETIAYITSPGECGSGGCRAVVLTIEGNRWRTVMSASVTRLPILMLETRSNGWRDLAVGTGGGGLPSGMARMRYDGMSYPDNPTVPPAEPIDAPQGEVLIDEAID